MALLAVAEGPLAVVAGEAGLRLSMVGHADERLFAHSVRQVKAERRQGRIWNTCADKRGARQIARGGAAPLERLLKKQPGQNACVSFLHMQVSTRRPGGTRLHATP